MVINSVTESIRNTERNKMINCEIFEKILMYEVVLDAKAMKEETGDV